MKKLVGLAGMLVLACLFQGCGRNTGYVPENAKYDKSFTAMDTYMTFTAYGKNAENGLEDACRRVQEMENICSVTREGSEIYGVNHRTENTVSLGKESAKLLREAMTISERSGGAFDVTMYPVLQLWGFTNGEYQVPGEEALKEARPALAQAWRSFIDYNPHNGVLVAATQLGEVLEIYNLQNGFHRVCLGPKGEPEFKLAGGYAIPDGIMGFSDVQVTNEAIYAVFHGHTFKEIMAQHQKEGRATDGGQYIYVFNLQGEPLCKYTLDRYITGFHVDERNKTITATDVNNDQPIVEFRFG